jgi:hypothetical protein
MKNVIDLLRFLSAIRCDTSTELEFVASHFYDFLCRRDSLMAFPFSVSSAIVSHRSLRLDSEGNLYIFISKGTETNREMIGLLEFARFEFDSMNVMNDLFGLLSEHSCEISIFRGLSVPNSLSSI